MVMLTLRKGRLIVMIGGVRLPEPNGSALPLSGRAFLLYTIFMMKNVLTLPAGLPLPTVQERLAYAWAVAQSELYRAPSVSERLLERCREAAGRLSVEEALELLEEVPSLQVA